MSDVSHFRYMIPTVITRAGREYCRYLTVMMCNLFDTATEAGNQSFLTRSDSSFAKDMSDTRDFDE